MTDVTYIRITSYPDGKVPTTTPDPPLPPEAGETGTWIPVADLDLQTLGTDPTNLSLSFQLSNDDAIINKVEDSFSNAAPLEIEIATVDPSIKTPGFTNGTLLSYAVTSSALLASVESSAAGSTSGSTATTGNTSFQFKLSDISQTTYPNGLAAASSSSATTTSGAVAPTPVPQDILHENSVGKSTSVAPADSSLSYYVSFKGLSSSVDGTYFAIDDVSSGISRQVRLPSSSQTFPSFSNPTLSDVRFDIENLAAIEGPLLQSEVNGSSFTMQIEAVSGGKSPYVVDNTVYTTTKVASSTTSGTYAFTAPDFYSQHFGASGSVLSSSGYDTTTTSANAGPPVIAAALPPSGLGAGAPFDSDVLGFDSSGRTTASYAITNVATSLSSTSTSTPSTLQTTDLTFGSQDKALAIALDTNLLKDTFINQYDITQQINGITGREFSVAGVQGGTDAINLVSGGHSYSLAYQGFGYQQSDGMPFSGVDASTLQTATNTSYVQFRDPTTGDAVMSSTGQSWFAVSAANFIIGQPGSGGSASTSPTLSDLTFTLGQDAVTGTLDADLAAGTQLTAEIATYGSNGTIQSDYLFGLGTLDSHNGTSVGTNTQALGFDPTIFQETQYDSTGTSIGSVEYDATTKAFGPAIAVLAGKTAPTTTNAQPAPVDTYVQFMASNDTDLTSASGSSWFEVTGTNSGLDHIGSQTVLGPLSLSLGDTDVATQLDNIYLSPSGVKLDQVNVATYTSGGAFQSYQSYSGATITSSQASNQGGDNQFTFSYTGYGERIAGTNPTNDSTASAGFKPAIPTVADDLPVSMLDASTPGSLSQLSYVAELLVTGGKAFVGTTSGFVALPVFSVDLSSKSASFEADQTQAAAIAAALYQQPFASLEIAGYASGGNRSIDYILSGASVTSTSLDTTTGLDTVQLGYANIQETNTTSPASVQTARTGGAQHIDAPEQGEPAVCFAAGTRITTHRGDVAVEDLTVGDIAVTASGEHRPIRWLGHRTIDCRCHPSPHDAHPVRIAAHAFAPNQPTRELFLSPGHPVLVGADADHDGGHLVPIMCLINGTTVRREAVAAVTYWHVELDEHDILLAENLPAESYIDLGSRPWFAGAGALYDPDMAAPGLPGRCRPVAIDGPVVETERRRLDGLFAMRLAAACAWPGARDPLLAM